jgi:NAD(P)-dependent dehydrogenase (short-subunit alcohol dehydrogenase family)
MTTITPFGATSTAADVIAGVDLTGKRAVVTGGASGIGFETALALATAGASVTLAVRAVEAGEQAAGRIRAIARGDIHVARLDLADRASIAEFVEGWHGALDILVNNAGIMALPELSRTAEGWEAQFGTNHLGHAALLLGLHDALAAAGSARVVVVSSSAHLMGPVDFDDIQFDERPYEAWSAYAQSKTATMLFALAASEKWAVDGITVNSLHPGGIMTNLQRHLDDAALAFVGAKDADGTTLDVPPGWKTPQQGAATSVLLAASPLVEGVTGRYFEDANESPVTDRPTAGGTGAAYWAADRDAAERLWNVTIALLAA